MVHLNRRPRLQTLRDHQNPGGVPGVEASLLVRCVTQHNGRPIAEIEAVKLINIANKVTSIVQCDFPFVAMVNSVMIFSASFEEDHGESFLAAGMVDFVEHMVFPDLLSGNSPQKYQRYMRVAKLLLQFPNIPNIIDDVVEEETASMTLGISHLNAGILISSWTEKEALLVRASRQCAWNPMKRIQFNALSFYENEK